MNRTARKGERARRILDDLIGLAGMSKRELSPPCNRQAAAGSRALVRSLDESFGAQRRAARSCGGEPALEEAFENWSGRAIRTLQLDEIAASGALETWRHHPDQVYSAALTVICLPRTERSRRVPEVGGKLAHGLDAPKSEPRSHSQSAATSGTGDTLMSARRNGRVLRPRVAPATPSRVRTTSPQSRAAHRTPPAAPRSGHSRRDGAHRCPPRGRRGATAPSAQLARGRHRPRS